MVSVNPVKDDNDFSFLHLHLFTPFSPVWLEMGLPVPSQWELSFNIWIWGRSNSVHSTTSACFLPPIYRSLSASVFPFSLPSSIFFAHGLMPFLNYFFFYLGFWKEKRINMSGHFFMCNCMSRQRVVPTCKIKTVTQKLNTKESQPWRKTTPNVCVCVCVCRWQGLDLLPLSPQWAWPFTALVLQKMNLYTFTEQENPVPSQRPVHLPASGTSAASARSTAKGSRWLSALINHWSSFT